jgi:hypothetical protein
VNQETKVEMGVEIPKAASGAERVYGFLYEMPVGGSVLLNKATLNKASFLMSRSYAQKKYGKHFITRTDGSNLRVWRTK